MTKKAFLIVIGIIIVFSLFLSKFSSGAKTIEEALNTPGLHPISIIHEEKESKGSIVFYTREGEDSLYTCFVRKSINGYKYIYGGVQGDIKLAAKTFGVSYNYFPAIEKTPFPIYFGIIGNPDIEQVKIIEQKRNMETEAKIINANGTKIWLVYMNKLEGSEFEIIGLSSDGKEVAKIKDNISPWYAEQKPFKSPIK